LITSSGDSTCIYWDVNTCTPATIFSEHTGDVMAISLFPNDPNLFLSGSIDATARIWDIRAKQCVGCFSGHESDINSVDVFPDGKCFGTGSDDSTCRFFDTRCYRHIGVFADPKILCGITSISFSKSGRLLFGGYDDSCCYAWDVQNGKLAQALSGHENRVSSVAVNKDGSALATGSWDTLLKVWTS
jgi:guanine nucleotide-binding protein G(I)/G(S)/G(T) subunit beta-1